MADEPQLLDQVRSAIRVRHYSPRTDPERQKPFDVSKLVKAAKKEKAR